MKRIINGTTYNTSKSKTVFNCKHTTDSRERLEITRKGCFFLHKTTDVDEGNNFSTSEKHGSFERVAEEIIPLTEEEAVAWLKERVPHDPDWRSNFMRAYYDRDVDNGERIVGKVIDLIEQEKESNHE
jgi:hypothetical protein